jgi:hypothetical protein
LNNSLQIERELSHHDALTLGYVRTAARELGFLRNMNLINPISYLADGRPVFSTAVNAATRVYPQFNAITLQDLGAISDYNAMIVHYTHRFATGFLASASYTWSHSISDAPMPTALSRTRPSKIPPTARATAATASSTGRRR